MAHSVPPILGTLNSKETSLNVEESGHANNLVWVVLLFIVVVRLIIYIG